MWYDVLFMSNPRYTLRCKKLYKDNETEHDVVVGPIIKKEHYESCGIARIGSERCGPEGKWWQPKNKDKFFTYMKRV